VSTFCLKIFSSQSFTLRKCELPKKSRIRKAEVRLGRGPQFPLATLTLHRASDCFLIKRGRQTTIISQRGLCLIHKAHTYFFSGVGGGKKYDSGLVSARIRNRPDLFTRKCLWKIRFGHQK
jgi:hypothetical protein